MIIAPEDLQFEALIDYIKSNRGLDFTGYKRSSLRRRVSRRMQMLNLEGYNNYLDYLQVHPNEFAQLFNTLLINVTSFFRDIAAWDYLISDILPQILSSKLGNETIRIWSAGCATGEEAYTIAIALAQIIGIDQVRERVKIYATDLDEDALNQARAATYSPHQLTGLSADQLEQFFEPSEDCYTFHKELRRSVIFGRHDLVQDAPISRIDLLLCRNTLMYFNADTQSRILARFHFALRDGGFLFLGKAEMLATQSGSFATVNLKCRFFTKVSRTNLRDRMLFMAQPSHEDGSITLNQQVCLREAAFESSPLARLVVDTEGQVALISEQARKLFNLSVQDIGRPLQNLEVSYRPVELRSRIEEAGRERRSITLHDIALSALRENTLYLDVQVTPLFDLSNTLLGVSITFTDVTRYKRLQEELEQSNQELEMAYEELQSANEELETTNEELQSSSEELETTNEELQSTNEELETMNEELQSANEELQSLNEELHSRSEELNQSNAFLEAILTSLKGGVVVVNRDLQVEVWNHRTEDLWGLRADEVLNQNFINLDIGLPTEQLLQPIKACLAGSASVNSEYLLKAVNRRGRNIQISVTCTPLLGLQDQILGVILVMEERNDS